jgi:HEAT repeat protein
VNPPRTLLATALLATACRFGGGIESPWPERRAAAVERLAGSHAASDLPVLLVAQNDPSPLVRKAAAVAFAGRGGTEAVESLGKLVADPDADVAVAAARGLSALGPTERVRELLVEAYPRGAPAARAEIAVALETVGGSLREAVELEARQLWDRNLQALQQGTPAERAGAAEELGRSGRNDAVRLLSPLLDVGRAGDLRVVAAAARGLGVAHDPTVRTSLEDLLDQTEDPLVAESVIEALGLLGDAEAASALAEIGIGDSTILSAAAVEALADLPQAPNVGTALCQLALKVHDPKVSARAAAQARAREGECPSRPLLARIARRGEDAIGALAAIGQLHLTPDDAAAAQAAIEPLLGSSDGALRTAAEQALGRVGNAKALAVLSRKGNDAADRLERSRKAGDAAAAAQAAVELGATLVARARLHAPDVGALAVARTGDAAPELRAAAVEALGVLGREALAELGSGASEKVAAALDDPDPRVWQAAMEASGRIGPPAVPWLSQGVAQAVAAGHDRAAALARALGETGAPEAVPALATLAQGPASDVAATALGRIGTREATATLRMLLETPGLVGRAEAVEALGNLGEMDAGAGVARELTSDRAEVRAAAARAVGKLRYAPASERLSALRSDYDGQVRRAAVEALAKLPGASGNP